MITYKKAGVDIDKANTLVKDIKKLSYQTKTENVVSGIGGFAAAFKIPKDIQNPILLASTDGVGTKILWADNLNQYDTIGIDLVAMCVNDIICTGGKPLVLLDYYVSGKLYLNSAKEIMKGISKGCQQAGVALIGGETAEMPLVYDDASWDLAGFCIGVVEEKSIIDGTNIETGNVLIGIPSSGLHSNGYSLVHQLTKNVNVMDTMIGNKPLWKELLEPTKIYVGLIMKLIDKFDKGINGIANITGGGIVENVPRMLSTDSNYDINVDYKYIIKNKPNIFNWLQEKGNISDKEMLRTFNCGIGMVLCVDENIVDGVLKELDKRNEKGVIIGSVVNE